MTGWTESEYRDFARSYIRKRLAEGEQDAVEEMAAYLAQWLLMQDRLKEALAHIEASERRQRATEWKASRKKCSA